MSRRWEAGLLALAAMMLSAGWLAAGGHGRGCDHCGGCQQVEKVCRVECGKKTITETKYKMECEDFCIPGPSEKCDCAWIPGCGEVRTKRKLIKYEEKKEVPDYKWKVEILCPSCCSACGAMPIPAGGLPAEVPVPPAPQKTAGAYEMDPPSAPAPIRSTGFKTLARPR